MHCLKSLTEVGNGHGKGKAPPRFVRRVIEYVPVRVKREDLVTQSEARELLGVSLVGGADVVERSDKLTLILDMDVVNPQHRRRLVRAEVRRWRRSGEGLRVLVFVLALYLLALARSARTVESGTERSGGANGGGRRRSGRGSSVPARAACTRSCSAALPRRDAASWRSPRCFPPMAGAASWST